MKDAAIARATNGEYYESSAIVAQHGAGIGWSDGRGCGMCGPGTPDGSGFGYNRGNGYDRRDGWIYGFADSGGGQSGGK